MALQVLTDSIRIVTDDFANHTLITIPAGRMRGDVDGDGKITSNSSYQTDTSTDAGLIYAHYKGTQEFIDETQILCADLNSNGRIDATDISLSKQIAEGNVKAGRFCNDILGNWTNNPNYATEEGQFYTDIPITGMTANSSASVIVKGTYESGFFTKAECISGAIRIYAKLCPISALTAVVSWGTGDGTAVITTESVDLTVYAEHIANADIHVTTEEKAVWSEKEVFMVTLQWDESDLENPKWIPDKTFNEIIDAYNSGKYVYCKTTDGMTDNILSLIFVDPNYSVYFQSINHTGERRTIICNGSDEWTDEINDFVPHSDSSNAGQILMVDSNGIPQWTAIINAEGVAY